MNKWLLIIPVIWGIIEEIYNIYTYRRKEGIVKRNTIFRIGYVCTPAPLFIYELSAKNNLVWVITLGWIILIKTMAIPSKIKYKIKDSVGVIAFYSILIALLIGGLP